MNLYKLKGKIKKLTKKFFIHRKDRKEISKRLKVFFVKNGYLILDINVIIKMLFRKGDNLL